MKPFHSLTACLPPCTATTASAQTLLFDRARMEPEAMPARGSTTAAVESRFGFPVQKRQPRGRQHSQWPEITRWAYPDLTVYFGNGRVVDAVAKCSHPEELGLQPSIR